MSEEPRDSQLTARKETENGALEPQELNSAKNLNELGYKSLQHSPTDTLILSVGAPQLRGPAGPNCDGLVTHGAVRA